ncbi:MAG: helix-turn-helix transcriptional regulator [Cellulosilyticum sp.]|nr:helix-turn-helix transcriptional regulator [Cellulosilyticum sp.]
MQFRKKILIKFSIKIGDLIKRKIGATNFDALFDQHVHYFTEIGYDSIQKKFFEMLEVYKDYDRYTDEILQGMLFHLFTLITKYKEMPSNAVPISFETKNESIIKALEYLSTYMQDAPSMEAVASYVGLTPSYFSRLFKKSTGKTFSEYVLFLRLQSSRILLMQTDLSVQQIAEQIGLCNGNYLSNLFKKYYLESPSEFRKHCNPNTQSDIVNKPLYDGL